MLKEEGKKVRHRRGKRHGEKRQHFRSGNKFGFNQIR